MVSIAIRLSKSLFDRISKLDGSIRLRGTCTSLLDHGLLDRRLCTQLSPCPSGVLGILHSDLVTVNTQLENKTPVFKFDLWVLTLRL